MKAWERFQQVVYMTDVTLDQLFDCHFESVKYVYGPYREQIEAAFDKMRPVVDALPPDQPMWDQTNLELAKQQLLALMKQADI